MEDLGKFVMLTLIVALGNVISSVRLHANTKTHGNLLPELL
jgi:ABC-type xylose transport system permease subunit